MFRLEFAFIVFLFFSCTTSSHVDVSNVSLNESFEKKDEQQFLKQFPKNFDQFHNLFGWNAELDEPEELYYEYEKYIQHWFLLLLSEKNESNEKYIVEICKEGEWEPNGIDYFQDCTIAYIKQNQKYHLINDLNDTDAFSVILFLFHSSGSIYDEEFGSNLDSTKSEMLSSLFLSSEEVNSEDNADLVETYSLDLDGDQIMDQINVLQNKEIEDEYDRSHFGLMIELRKGNGNEFVKWKSNGNIVFQLDNSCLSNGFESIYVNEDKFIIAQQTCYDYTILVTSYASFTFEEGQVYLSEYREKFFDKANHEAEIPTQIWTQSDFGKLKFEDVTNELIEKWVRN